MSSLTHDWATAVGSLVGRGWFHAEGALSYEVANDLRAAAPDSWHPLQEDEGGVRQFGFGAYLPFVESPDPVVRVGTELVSQLSRYAEATGHPPVPSFNEVTWTSYPEGKGHITAHRDPPGAGGVIAVLTLEGGQLSGSRTGLSPRSGTSSPVISSSCVGMAGRPRRPGAPSMPLIHRSARVA